MSERRRSAFLGALFGYLGLTVVFARNILLVPLYLQWISLAQYGAWLATGGALALILINDYGLSGVVTQKISSSYGAGEFRLLGSLAASAIAIGLCGAIMLTAISLAFVPFLPGLDSLTPAEAHTVATCFQIAIASNALGIVGATATSVIRSLQRVVLSGSIGLSGELANIAVTILGLLDRKGLYAIAAGMLARSIVITLASLLAVWAVCSRSLRTKLAVSGRVMGNLLGESSRFLLAAIAMKLQSQANVFFVSSILGPASAAIYSLTVRAHETVMMLISQITGALLPSVTHLFGSGNMARFHGVLLRLLMSIGALTAFALTMTVILDEGFLKLWVGHDAFGGQRISTIMAVGLFISAIGYVAYDSLLAQGKFRFVANSFFAASVIQIVLLMSCLRWGIWFAPMATSITAGIWCLGFWRKVVVDLSISVPEVRRAAMELARVAALSALTAVGFILFYPAATSWTGLVTEGLCCLACLSAACLGCSPRIRGIALEEIDTTLRLFRA